MVKTGSHVPYLLSIGGNGQFRGAHWAHKSTLWELLSEPYPQGINGTHICSRTLPLVRDDWTKIDMSSILSQSASSSWEFGIGLQRWQSWVAWTRGCKHLGQSLCLMWKEKWGQRKIPEGGGYDFYINSSLHSHTHTSILPCHTLTYWYLPYLLPFKKFSRSPQMAPAPRFLPIMKTIPSSNHSTPIHSFNCRRYPHPHLFL